MTDITIRNEEVGDFREVERLVREAFWNVNVPGCCEHYLAHILRSHADFVPELDLVAQTANGTELSVLTFEPLSVRPGFQQQGIGRRLLEESFERARAMGFAAVVIFGSPGNYVSRGFKSCRKHGVRTPDAFPARCS